MSVNGFPVGEASWDGKLPHLLEVEVAPSVLHDGENSLEIENPGDTGATNSLAILDRFALTYPRRLVAAAGELHGWVRQGGIAEVLGLGAGSRVLDTTEPVARWLIARCPAERPSELHSRPRPREDPDPRGPQRVASEPG